MGNGGSKKKKTNSGKSSTTPTKKNNNTRPKTMPYKRQFSADKSRTQQSEHLSEYRAQTMSIEPGDTQQIVPSTTNTHTTSSLTIDSKKPDYNAAVLDPKKYKPPPSPVQSSDAPFFDESKKNEKEKENDGDSNSSDDEEMTEAQALHIIQIKLDTERGLSPGVNIVSGDEDDTKQTDNTQTVNNSNKDSSHLQSKNDDNNMSPRSASHSRVQSKALDQKVVCSVAATSLLWGYCELTRKQLDEDQAAFSTWTHETDGFVHAWAVFDGHGGYECALYSAQHFLKYLEKYHTIRKNIKLTDWPKLMKEIFCKFDEHVGNLNIRGGSTVVVCLLIGRALIVANAGDARAIMSHKNGKALELSKDHTPMNDYDRLVKLAQSKSNQKKISKFFRINGKNETYADVQKLPAAQLKKAPFISREQDKSRLLGTIGVARGFGDFSLSVFGFRNIQLKPFLSAEPYVFIKELDEKEVLKTDIMCVACDGVFDVMSNQEVIDTLRREIYFRKPKNELEKNKENGNENDKNENKKEEEKSLYTNKPNFNINSNIVDRACGFLGLRSYAKGTMDDVTIFTVPLRQIFDFTDPDHEPI